MFATIFSRIEDLLSKIKECRNQLSSIYRLPNEILTAILELMVHSPENSVQRFDSRAPINFSRVTRLWRDIALSAPNLWSTIDVMNIHVAPTFLAHSKSAPLYIDLAPGRVRPHVVSTDIFVHLASESQYFAIVRGHETLVSQFPRLIRPILSHIERCRSLRIRGIELEELAVFDTPAPNLESFYACYNDSSETFDEERSDAHLFKDSTPRLRELELIGICVPLNVPIYRGLVRLSLERVGFLVSPINMLLDALAACPLLEFFSLMDVQFEQDYFTQNPPIPLLHLQDLLLDEVACNSVHSILTSIQVPPSLKMAVYVDSQTDLRAILPPPMDLFDRLPHLSRICHLRVFGSPNRENSFGDNAREYCVIHEVSAEPRVLISVEEAYPEESLAESLCLGLGQDLPLPHLTQLELCNILEPPYGYVPPDITQSLQSLSTITTLVMENCYSELMLLLIPDPLFPLLRTLELRKCTISAVNLLSVIGSRTTTSKGGAFSELILRKCRHANSDVVQQLKELSVEVDWDGWVDPGEE